MKNECNIVRDILPLYVEDIASEDTALFLQEHISVCSKCRAEYESMKNPDVITSIQKESTPLDAAPIKAIKKLLIIKRMQTIIFTAMIVMALLISFYAALDAPNFFPYNDELHKLTLSSKIL